MSVEIEISDEEKLSDHVPNSQPQTDNTDKITGVLEEMFKDKRGRASAGNC